MVNKSFFTILATLILFSSISFARGPSIGYMPQKTIKLNNEEVKEKSCHKKRNSFLPHRFIKI